MKRRREEETREEQEPAKEPAKAKRERKPLDLATLTPEAAEHLAKGSDAREKLRVSAAAVELLGLEGTARQLWKVAERAFAAAERGARKIQRDGSREEREAKRKERKLEQIAKLRVQLEALEAEEAAASK